MRSHGVTGRDAFGLVFDNLLGHQPAQIRRDIALYGLLYDKVLCPDSWFMTNGSLQSVLSRPDGASLFQEVIVPVRRDNVASFKELHAQVKARNMYGLCATDAFVEFLDREVTCIASYASAEVSAAYVRMSQAVLAPETLITLGVSEASAKVVERLVREAGNRADSNTFVKDEVCPLLPKEDGVRTMEIVRAPYGLNLPMLLGSGIAGPVDYRGHEILAVLKRQERKTAAVTILGDGKTLGQAFRSVLGDARINWLFSVDVLERLTAEDLAAARSTSDRSTYLDRLSDFLSAPDQTTWFSLVAAMSVYLQKAADEVMRLWIKNGKFGNEPGEGQIVIEGTNTLKVLIPDKPVELAGITTTPVEKSLTVQVPDVQVIGRTLSIPKKDKAP